jgi:Helix-turn-helix of insertion element transposase
MTDNGRLTERQRRVIPYLLTSPSTEEACRRAKINKTTVYEWRKDEAFRNELKSQRDAVIEHALDTLKASIAKATETLVKLLDSDKEGIQARAAEDIVQFTQKALEHEELEKRIEALEARIGQQRENYNR